MRINWLAYNYRSHDGYGRYSLYMIRALRCAGHDVRVLLTEQCNAPAWLQEGWGIDWTAHAVSCLPPFYLNGTPSIRAELGTPAGSGLHWLLSMTEGSSLPKGWAETINRSNVSRVIVPCAHNADVFARGGVAAPVSIVPGGTDPDDFPLLPVRLGRPYTFLAVADRGARKGWVEVWQAFYRAFGGPGETADVRLIIKARPNGNDMLELIAGAEHPDPRISILFDDLPNIADFYAMGNCLVIPSRSEGWGMIMREGAMSGLPVITQRYSGMDDGWTDAWAIVVERGHLERIPTHFEHIAGDWRKADVDELAQTMRRCYDDPGTAADLGAHAAAWLRDNQTWDHSAARLVELLQT